MNRAKYGIIAALVLVLILWLKGCFTKELLPESFTAPLDPETVSQVQITGRNVAVRTNKEVKGTYVADGGHTLVTIKKDGTVKLETKSAGLTFRPVLGFLLTDKFKLAAGVQVFYWDRFEIYVGGAFPKPVAFGGLGYRLDTFKLLQNTSVVVTYNTAKELGAGVLVRF